MDKYTNNMNGLVDKRDEQLFDLLNALKGYLLTQGYRFHKITILKEEIAEQGFNFCNKINGIEIEQFRVDYNKKIN